MEVFNKLKAIADTAKENEPLANHTVFQIGGPAKYFCVANSFEELKKFFEIAQKAKLPILVLGGGSNLLVSDKGFAGLAIKLNLNRVRLKDGKLEAEAGALFSKVVGEALSLGLAGLEWAAGIPGTMGGALFGNAGAYGQEMKNSIENVSVLRRGKLKTLKNKDCCFGYRESIFKKAKNNDIIVSAVFDLQKGEVEKIKQKTKEILEERKQKFEAMPSAGSVFKNIEISGETGKNIPNLPEQFVSAGRIPAGWLIDQCGLKGKITHGAKISEKHANMILNFDGATAEDVLALIALIKKEVKNKFNFDLEEEIRLIGF